MAESRISDLKENRPLLKLLTFSSFCLPYLEGYTVTELMAPVEGTNDCKRTNKSTYSSMCSEMKIEREREIEHWKKECVM